MPPAQQHSLDRLANELADYIEASVEYLSNALLEGGHAPFEAKISEAERFGYFHGLLWNEDDTPNEEGRSLLEEQRGLDEYTRTYRWVEARKKRGMPRGVTPRQERESEDEEP